MTESQLAGIQFIITIINGQSWKNLWTPYLSKNRSDIALAICHLDGSHSPAKQGGEGVAYSSRKRCKTTNSLFLTDKNGIPVAMSVPQGGNHHDAFELEKNMQTMLVDLNKANIRYEGIFLNADAAFDTNSFRSFCSHMDIVDNIDFNKRNRKKILIINHLKMKKCMIYIFQ
ncbi:transposase family protein [Bernardetia litoralis]|uniref:transposase family protein n=1 Tax=Bernardetia litoralis TaxID=999 RepID=UPI000307B3B6|nr:transposase family protein [Bernardetia litoralis]